MIYQTAFNERSIDTVPLRMTFESIIRKAKHKAQVNVTLISDNCFHLTEKQWIDLYCATIKVSRKRQGIVVERSISIWAIKQAYLNRRIEVNDLLLACWNAWNTIIMNQSDIA